MRRCSVLSTVILLVGALTSSATVTVQGWWHYGEVSDYYADSSGHSYRFGYGYSTVGSGNAGAGIVSRAVGGPLGNTGWVSTNSLYWTPTHATAAGMWGTGYNPPAANYVMECWCLPEWPGTRGGNGAWLFSSGTGGGVRFRLTNDTASVMVILAEILGNGTVIGDPLVVDTNGWTHLAIVNENGTNTFYVNGVKHGASTDPGLNTTPAGDMFGGSASGTQPTFCGYLDELRICTFASGQFSTSDLLLRPTGPNILIQPQSATVWNGGAAPFSISTAFGTTTSYQWQRNGVNISGATRTAVVLPQVATADSGTSIRCILTGSSVTVTSAAAILTVVDPIAANVNAYRSAVMSESSLKALFAVDGCTGSTVSNLVDSAHNGTLELDGNYDGRTNRAFAQRSLSFNLDGDVTIASNPAYEFASGNGTVEALIYLSQTTATDPSIFAIAYDYSSTLYYGLRVSKDGTSLLYTNDAGVGLSWVAPANLVGAWTHVAFVFENGSNITAYANGTSLGTKTHPNFGTSPGSPAWIGSSGINADGFLWAGTIDELAIYSAALSANTIAIHNSKFLYGTNTSAPTITSIPATGTKNLLTGGAPYFMVKASGTAPLAYQWTLNGAAISGATASVLNLSHTTASQSGVYGVTVSNPYGTTNSPTFTLNFSTPPDQYAVRVMNDNPAAFWRLDETNGTMAFDVAGGHDGTYMAGSSPGYILGTNGVLPGIANTAVRFVAPNATYGGRVEVPFSPVFNPSGPFSVECFCIPNYDGDDSGGYLVSSQNRPTGVRQGWMLAASGNSVQYDFFICNGSGTPTTLVGGPHCYPNVLRHVAGVYDGTNAYIYVDGVLSGTLANPTFVPNPSNPLEIGVRNGNGIAFDGVIDEVAYYGYALTGAQISNHWSILLEKATIVTQPVGVTNIEGSTIDLTAVAKGYVNTYQWVKDSSDLVEVANPDGTAHYPNGVAGTTLRIAQTTPADSGMYRLSVINPVGNASSVNVRVLILPDTNAPTVTAVQALGTPNMPPNTGSPVPYLVKVLFNKRIDPGWGTYTIPGVTINSATVQQDVRALVLGGDWREVILYTSGLTPGQQYTLTVSGVKDQTVAANQLATTNITFRAPLLSQGMAVWDYYYLGATSSTAAIGDLTNNVNYPNAPMTNWGVTTFDSTPITGGQLDNLSYGTTGNRYGSSLSAWLTPQVSGDYTFFLASDDASELWLGSTPQTMILIAYEPGCCHGFVEPTSSPTYTSQPIPLVANTPYFIRALHVEGSGGDYVKVAWRIAGDTTAAASLKPIPGTYLSSYAPSPITLYPPSFSGGQLTIQWTGTATLLQSPNLIQWTPVPGNPTSPYTVTPAPGTPQMFYILRQ